MGMQTLYVYSYVLTQDGKTALGRQSSGDTSLHSFILGTHLL